MACTPTTRSPPGNGRQPTSLSTLAARQLATTTKSEPQMQAITSRWPLRMLPCVDVRGGAYRINRRLQLSVGRGLVRFEQNGADDIKVILETLTELPLLRGYSDTEVLKEVAGRFRAMARNRLVPVHVQDLTEDTFLDAYRNGSFQYLLIAADRV